ncbi:MAG: hypothetical protein SP1CHLAM54_16480 [Chlamydiia bacterium]|nr:hypothetical protein [Chlamydiia bacterium]MCH9616537.1 hypothetical protein [Chlamydiia bacterium]MCH9629267.1 hypothetical protein [Chlamydiia bacterium]
MAAVVHFRGASQEGISKFVGASVVDPSVQRIEVKELLGVTPVCLEPGRRGTILRSHYVAMQSMDEIRDFFGSASGVKKLRERDVWFNTPAHYAALAGNREALEFFKSLDPAVATRLNHLGGTADDLLALVSEKTASVGPYGWPLLECNHVDPEEMLKFWWYVRPGDSCLDEPEGLRGAVEVWEGGARPSLAVDRVDHAGRVLKTTDAIPCGAVVDKYCGEIYFAGFSAMYRDYPEHLFRQLPRSEYLGMAEDAERAGSRAALVADGLPLVKMSTVQAKGGLPWEMVFWAQTDVPPDTFLTATYDAHPMRFLPSVNLNPGLTRDIIDRIVEKIGAGNYTFSEFELHTLRYLMITPRRLIELLTGEGPLSLESFAALVRVYVESPQIRMGIGPAQKAYYNFVFNGLYPMTLFFISVENPRERDCYWIAYLHAFQTFLANLEPLFSAEEGNPSAYFLNLADINLLGPVFKAFASQNAGVDLSGLSPETFAGVTCNFLELSLKTPEQVAERLAIALAETPFAFDPTLLITEGFEETRPPITVKEVRVKAGAVSKPTAGGGGGGGGGSRRAGGGHKKKGGKGRRK